MSLIDGDFTIPSSLMQIPARKLVNIVPNDSADLTNPVRGIYIGSGGDLNMVAIDDIDGATQTLTAVPQGVIFPAFAKRVTSTGTVASNLIGIL